MIRTALLALAAAALAFEASAQAPAPAFARTKDGHPDFQGVWDSPWLTPIERPAGLALVVSETEAAAIAAERRTYPGRNALNVPSILDSTDYAHLLTINGQRRTSQIIDPPDGKVPYTEKGKAIASGTPSYEGTETMQPQSRCIVVSGAPPMFIIPADTLRQIVQTPDAVVILSEWANDLRIIPIDAAHRPAALTSAFGDSTGRWEGDTLVVETTHYRADMQLRSLASNRLVLGPATRTVERFSFIGPDEILYRYTVEDPALYIRAWTAEYTLLRRKTRLYETACHEGNYGLVNILRGARVTEERAKRR